MFFNRRKKAQQSKEKLAPYSDKDASLFLAGKPLLSDSKLPAALDEVENLLRQDRYSLENSNKVNLTKQEALRMIKNWELDGQRKRRQNFVVATMFGAVFILLSFVGLTLLTTTEPQVQPASSVQLTAGLQTPAKPTVTTPTATANVVVATSATNEPMPTLPTTASPVSAATASPTTANPVSTPTAAPTTAVATSAPTVQSSGSGKLVYETFSLTNPEILISNPDGTERKKIGEGQAPVFSPDAKQIAFGKVIAGQLNERPFQMAIVRTDLNGQNLQTLCQISENMLVWPQRWSPSARFIAFIPVRLNAGASTLLNLCNPADGSTLEPKRPQGPIQSVFDWSLDGNYAIWQVGESISNGIKVDYNIYYGDPDKEGKEATLLVTSRKEPSITPEFRGGRFAPDNKTIGLCSENEIRFVSVPGQKSPLENKVIQLAPELQARTIAFSPDGKKLAILARPGSAEPSNNYRKLVIRFVSLETANFGEITKLPGEEIYVSSLDWSRR